MVGLARVPGTGGGGPGFKPQSVGETLIALKEQVVDQYDKIVAGGGDPSSINLDDLDLPKNPLVIVPDPEYHPVEKQQQEQETKVGGTKKDHPNTGKKNKDKPAKKPHSPEKTAQDKGYKLGEKTKEKVVEDTDWGLIGTIAVGALVVFYLMYQASSSGR